MENEKTPLTGIENAATEAVSESQSDTQSLPPQDNIGMLDEGERETYLETADLSEAEIGTLPPEMRAEVISIREKVQNHGTKDDDAPESATTETDDSADTADTADTAPENKEQTTETVSTEDSGEKNKEISADEIIRRLMEENRKLNARYDTLQGKYNAEVKHINKINRGTADANTAEGNNAASGDTAGTNAEPASGTSSQASTAKRKSNAELAEELNLDEDIISAIRAVMDNENAGRVDEARPQDQFNERLERLEAYNLNLELDAMLRESTGHGLHEIGSHPLFTSFAGEMVDKDGISAFDAIAEAKSRRDNKSAAAIVAQVVKEMDRQNAWNLYGRYSAEPAERTSLQTDSASAPAEKKESISIQQQANALPVSPHSAGGISGVVPTVRSADQVESEYNALEKRFRKGDYSVAARMEQLKNEYTKLLSRKQE